MVSEIEATERPTICEGTHASVAAGGIAIRAEFLSLNRLEEQSSMVHSANWSEFDFLGLSHVPVTFRRYSAKASPDFSWS